MIQSAHAHVYFEKAPGGENGVILMSQGRYAQNLGVLEPEKRPRKAGRM